MTTDTALKCENCGKPMEPQKVKRGDPKRFCTTTCRVEAYWKRKLVPPDQPDAGVGGNT